MTRVVKFVALVVLPFFGAFLVAEIVVRVLDPSGVSVFASSRAIERDVFRASDVPGVVFENAPNIDVDIGFRVVTNEQGLRGGPLVAKRPGVPRVMCLGDSVTFGFGVECEDAFPVQLKRLLAETQPCEVLNAGVVRWNAAQERAWLVAKGFALEPDLVIVTYVANDDEPVHPMEIHDDRGSLLTCPPRPPEYARAVSRFEWYLLKNQSELRLFDLARAWTLKRLLAPPSGDDADEMDRWHARQDLVAQGARLAVATRDKIGSFHELETIAHECRLRQVRFAIASFDGPPELKDVAHAIKGTWLAGTEGIGGRPVWRISELDAHPNRAGHAEFARRIAAALRATGEWP